MKNPFIALKEVFFGDTETKNNYSEEDLYKKAFTEKYISEDVRKELVNSLKSIGNNLPNKKRKFRVDNSNITNKGKTANVVSKDEEFIK